MEEFDSIHHSSGLAQLGFFKRLFDGCAVGIDKTRAERNDSQNKINQMKIKLESLKKAPAQRELEAAEIRIAELTEAYSKYQDELQKQVILNRTHGLAGSCSRLSNEQNTTRLVNEELGKITQEYNGLLERHNKYLPQLNVKIQKFMNDIAAVKTDLSNKKTALENKIAADKAAEDAKRIAYEIEAERLRLEAEQAQLQELAAREALITEAAKDKGNYTWLWIILAIGGVYWLSKGNKTTVIKAKKVSL